MAFTKDFGDSTNTNLSGTGPHDLAEAYMPRDVDSTGIAEVHIAGFNGDGTPIRGAFAGGFAFADGGTTAAHGTTQTIVPMDLPIGLVGTSLAIVADVTANGPRVRAQLTGVLGLAGVTIASRIDVGYGP